MAWSRKSGEIEDSKHITLVSASAMQYANTKNVKLPRFLKPMEFGTGNDGQVHDRDVKILTEQRIADINSILSMISTKCGYSQGAFVLDRKTGALTATQVESDDQDTIQTIKDVRDALKNTIEHLIYALNVYADLYGHAPVGTYETDYVFGDLLYNFEEDRARHWTYVQAGKYPLWKYFVKFEGMSEEEARETVKDAKSENDDKMFGEEE